MLASRLIERSRHQRRLVARLITRHALLRRTQVGARMLRGLADAEDNWAAPGASAIPADLPGGTSYEWEEPFARPASVDPAGRRADQAAPAIDQSLPEPASPQFQFAAPAQQIRQ